MLFNRKDISDAELLELYKAILKPRLKNKKVNNLFYTGQLTVPGHGVPLSIISGQIVAEEVHKKLS